MTETIKPTSIFQCPVCESQLFVDKKIWHCDASKSTNSKVHTFDVARQGYINLLQVQNKKTQNPGDSEESVVARQNFLIAGFYQPLQEKIQELVEDNIDKEETWLDIGCGEGYYTKVLQNMSKTINTVAVDISKPAVTTLAKNFKQNSLLWYQDNTEKNIQNSCIPIVTSAAHLPIKSNSVNVVTSIFSPILVNELIRVLMTKGYLIIAKPDIGHVASVRQGLFDEVREHHSDKFLLELEEKGFQLIKTHHISTEMALNKEQLSNLLTMTPYSYRAKKENRELLLAQAETDVFKTDAKFVIYLLKLK